VIEDPSVSRRHVRIGMAEGKPYVEDLNSLNGTLLDGAEVPQFGPVWFAAGQELTLARVVLAVARSELP
jgi:pSer/pThr/pTyr-binding forkhead associated (FHA) protein